MSKLFQLKLTPIHLRLIFHSASSPSFHRSGITCTVSASSDYEMSETSSSLLSSSPSEAARIWWVPKYVFTLTNLSCVYVCEPRNTCRSFSAPTMSVSGMELRFDRVSLPTETSHHRRGEPRLECAILRHAPPPPMMQCGRKERESTPRTVWEPWSSVNSQKQLAI